MSQRETSSCVPAELSVPNGSKLLADVSSLCQTIRPANDFSRYIGIAVFDTIEVAAFSNAYLNTPSALKVMASLIIGSDRIHFSVWCLRYAISLFSLYVLLLEIFHCGIRNKVLL